jgi:hypothetical protein
MLDVTVDIRRVFAKCCAAQRMFQQIRQMFN